MSLIIAGLGNPGTEYELTRHNTGRIILELAAKKWGIGSDAFVEQAKSKARVATGTISGATDASGAASAANGEKVTLVEPDNFMNRSGGSLTSLVTSAAKAKKLIVIHDDLDLPLGTLKISYNRGAGGHRGVESIIKSLKTQEFIRFRVGISVVTPGGKLKKPSGEEAVNTFIIGPFKKPELDILTKKIGARAIEAIETIAADPKSGLARAMSMPV